MLHFSEKGFPQLHDLISFLFQKAKENSRETYQYVISESIGEVSRINPEEMNKILSELPKMDEVFKCIVGNSLRYALEGKAPVDNFVPKDTSYYISSIMNLT